MITVYMHRRCADGSRYANPLAQTNTTKVAGQSMENAYQINISNNNIPTLTNHLNLGTHTNAKGESLDANSQYFIKNGKPWFPVMGEFHFSRYPRQEWEASILKMKACGIDVIATYVFWIYHEEEQGKWDWTGNRDLRYFAGLCAKHSVFLFARVGPWCHGEVRNGGFPDWLLRQPFKPRTNDSKYLGHVETFFQQVHEQLKGMYFKDGGPIIGAQMENEYRFNNPSGLAHILTLKKMAVGAGIDVPYYTATGWPGSNIKQTELVPVWGGYPEAPWDKKTTQLPLSGNYLFDSLRSDPTIGNDLLGNIKDTTNYKGYRYPYATAEIGGGIQITYHRRPIIAPEDVLGLSYSKTGSGTNLIGYYMFHGGSNPIGKLSTLQESKATKYPNDYPIINYDFQAPIGEWGELRPSYKTFKLFHTFLNNFGDRLAICYAYFPAKKPAGKSDSSTLRWSVRAKDGKGFIFINHFQRQLQMNDVANVQMNIAMKDGSLLKVPENAVTIAKNTQTIWPFNMDIETANLVYATAQPICTLNKPDEKVYVFAAGENIKPEYVFDKVNIKNITGTGVEKRSNSYKIIAEVGINDGIVITLGNGKKIRIITLSYQQALDCWKLTVAGKEQLFITNSGLIADNKTIRLQSTGNAVTELTVLGKTNLLKSSKTKTLSTKSIGLFTLYQLTFQAKEQSLPWTKKDMASPLSDTAKATSFLPLYDTVLKPLANAFYWETTIPKDALDGLSDAFVTIDYEGDTQAAYLDGKLIADDFYSGLPMTIGLNQFKPNVLGKKLQFLVTPLSDSSSIYFEKNIREPLQGKTVARVKSVTLLPQYETTISGF